MIMVLTAVAAATLPTALYALVLWWLDRYEKEPLSLLAVAFLWGSLPAIALALVAEFALGISAEQTFLGPGLVRWGLAPVIEELAKALAIIALFALARFEFDGPLDGIVYGALVGFGFSMTENLLYFLRDPAHLQALFWVRAVLFGSSHAFFSSLVGLALGSVRYARPGMHVLALAFGLGAAILFHALHNVAVSYQMPGLFLSWLVSTGGIVVVLLVAVLAWRHERAWMLLELPEEVRIGVISEQELAEALSISERLLHRLRQLVIQGPRVFLLTHRLYHLITELAFCKYQVRIGDPFTPCDERDRLRAQIAMVRALLREHEQTPIRNR